MRGEVVKLDRKYPLVRLEDGRTLRCEHTASLKKAGRLRAVIGDIVDVDEPDSHDIAQLAKIYERTTSFERLDPVNRGEPQTLAANFDQVAIVHPVNNLNVNRLLRELVLAHNSGAKVIVVLSKSDLVDTESLNNTVKLVKELAGDIVDVFVINKDSAPQIDALKKHLQAFKTTILIGSSGAGKSSLINVLVGADTQKTGEVRELDGKGRHTTVAREIIEIPTEKDSSTASRIVDMPGVRGLGLWQSRDGIAKAFSDIEELSYDCKFRDCSHTTEPGCAVLAAVDAGTLPKRRLDSYLALLSECSR